MITSLRGRIFLCILIAAAMASTCIYFILNQWILEYNQQQAQIQLKIALSLGEKIARAYSGDDWQHLAQELNRASGYRVSFISDQGQVLADTILKPEDFARQENHEQRIEITTALQAGFGGSIRYSSSLGEDRIYAAQPLSGRAIVLRLSAPLKSTQTFNFPWSGLLLPAAAALLLISVMSHGLAAVYDRPLREIVEALPALENGVCAFYWRIAAHDPGINKLGQVMEQTAHAIRNKFYMLNQDAMRLQSLLHSMVEPVFSINQEYRINLCNRAAEQLLGQDIIGQSPAAVIRSAELLAVLNQAANNKQPVINEIKLPGDQIWQAVCSPLPGADKLAEIVVVLHNITQVKKLETMRRDFVANFSHELRTPLAVIRGAQETLSDGLREDNEQKRFLDSIGRQAARLQNLTDDLLQLTRLESPQWHIFPKQRVAIHELLHEARLAVEDKGKTSQVAITVDIQESGLSIQGEYRTLEQAVINLLDNAIKYSPVGGQVVLRAYTAQTDLCIEVQDSGPGIAPEHQERVFERFYQIDKNRSSGGSGLGLAIARHAALLHGGQIKLHSQLNHGSTFTLILPFGKE
jgi:two-component system phosphate regulon sensor histidine kinase PhoR